MDQTTDIHMRDGIQAIILETWSGREARQISETYRFFNQNIDTFDNKY
jgi:hypothetical protein